MIAIFVIIAITVAFAASMLLYRLRFARFGMVPLGIGRAFESLFGNSFNLLLFSRLDGGYVLADVSDLLDSRSLPDGKYVLVARLDWETFNASRTYTWSEASFAGITMCPYIAFVKVKGELCVEHANGGYGKRKYVGLHPLDRKGASKLEYLCDQACSNYDIIKGIED